MSITRFFLMSFVLALLYIAALVGSMYPWLVFWIGVFLLFVAIKRGEIRFTSFGTARWADEHDLRKAGMLSGTGMILGRVSLPRAGFIRGVIALFNPWVPAALACEQFIYCVRGGHKPTELVRLNAVHTAVFAPTGVGKGVSCVIPHLLTCPDSTVVVDFKGENAKLTADARRAMGHKVVILDPFDVIDGKDTYNPLDAIDKDSKFALDICRAIANAIVVRTGNEHEPHWNDFSEAFIAAIIALVILEGMLDDRSLQTTRPLLTNEAKLKAAIALMCASAAWGGMLARLGHQLSQPKEKELASVLTTTNRHMRFLDTMAVAENTRKSTFDPAELVKGKMTVYLVLPPEHMRTQSGLLRLWIGSMINACIRGGLQETNKVHFICDEANSLGKMEQISDALTIGRGYGIRLQLYYQDCGELKRCWPDGADQTLLANTSQVYFGVNDTQTADYVSARLGEETIVVDSGGVNASTAVARAASGDVTVTKTRGTGDNWAQQGRKLLKPEEVMALSPRTAITFTPGIPPLWTTLVRYYEENLLGKPPGRFRCWWVGFKRLVWSATLLALAVMVAVLMTQNARKFAPNGSVHTTGKGR